MENNTNAKIMGGLVLAGAIAGGYFLFKDKSLNGFKPDWGKIALAGGAIGLFVWMAKAAKPNELQK